jgi:hypothetical protein
VLRYLPEIGTAIALIWLWSAVSSRLGAAPTLLLSASISGSLAWWPRSRRWLSAALGCVVTRHRLRTALLELRLTSRAGWLPLTLWLTATPVGERVWLWCRAGISAEDIADEVDRLRSACFARDVRVSRDRRWASLVSVDVVRRDPLRSARPVPSPLADEAGRGEADA